MCAKKKKSDSKKISTSKVVEESTQKAEKSTQKLEERAVVKTPVWVPILFLVVAFILYFQCIPYGYVLDDKIVLSENQYTTSGFSGIKDIFQYDTFQGYFKEKKDLLEGGRYRPLSLVTFAIEHEFAGLNPKLSHIINIILYGLCAWLIFVLLNLLLGSKNKWWWTIPFLTAIIYLVHPVHTEAVANIKGRDELMAMIFALLTTIACIKYGMNGKIKHLIFASILFLLGILSKENVITFLAVIPLAMWVFEKGSMARIATSFGILFSVFCIYLFTRYQIFGYILGDTEVTDIMNNPFADMDTSEKFGSKLYTMYEYLRLSFVPHPLTHDYYPYHIPKVGVLAHWKPIAAIIMHVALLAYSVLAFKKHRVISFAIWFYIATISIVSNFVVGVGTFMNERFIFISSMGVCLAIAYLLKRGSERWNPNIMYGLAAIIVLLFSIKTFTRVPAWESALTLNRSAVKVSTKSARSNSFMATALFEEVKVTDDRETKERLLNEAKIYAARALDVYPTYSNANLMKAGIQAELYKLDGDLAALLKTFTEVGAAQPQIGFLAQYCEYLNGRADQNQMLNFYYDLGYNTLYKKNEFNIENRLNWAIHFLNFGYQLNSSDPNIRRALYEIYSTAGNTQKAQEYR